MFKFNNGDKVKDRFGDYAGTVIGRTEWLNGCQRYCVQSDKLSTEGKPVEYSFDEQQLELVKPTQKTEEKTANRPGGPTTSMVSRPVAERR